MCGRPGSPPSLAGSQALLLLPLLLLLVLLPPPPAAAAPSAVAVRAPARGPPRTQYLEAIRPVMRGSDAAPLEPHGQQGIQQEGIQQGIPEGIQEVPEMVSAPRKRAAIVLDKLMFALQKALDDNPPPAPGPHPPAYPRSRPFAGTMDLQRRGNGDGRLYWRCYFNAVSCF
ncbi:uncharacterized protein LOC122256565 [Penaeus japonicus]|uniref:uncharacterized protein LOC122256565 n=1 Tax=Penaeus japonicus TaxID=27405 RepID=UPI001C7153BD|nr:uncharacterized protein LOC122256565 [Penaeus japonicus]